jgi:hypothetical protein
VVARNRIRCTVVAVTVSADRVSDRGALARDILPGADPYVAQLIRKLQDEVREERRLQSLVRSRSRFVIGDVLDSYAGN